MSNDPTIPAKELWAYLFPREAWPDGWRVAWIRSLRRSALGMASHEDRCIYLSATGSRRSGDVLETLVHEFVHVRCGPKFRHGKEFRKIENGIRARLGLGPTLIAALNWTGTYKVVEDNGDSQIIAGRTDAGVPVVSLIFAPRRQRSATRSAPRKAPSRRSSGSV